MGEAELKSEAGQYRDSVLRFKNVEEATNLLRESREAQRSQLEAATSLTDKVISYAGSYASLWEKFILLDVGTIALSITFLGYLISHGAGGHQPKWAVVGLLCPAWLLLLISIVCCWIQIKSCHNCNSLLLQQLSTRTMGQHYGDISLLLNRMAGLCDGQLMNGNEKIDVSNIFSEAATYVGHLSRDQFSKWEEVAARATENTRGVNRYAVSAIRYTIFAFLLLVIFAARAILSM
jgi:hypothetical protein